MNRPLTQQDHDRLADRIRAAEARTSGEIYCVVARASDSYLFPAACMLAVGVLVVGLPIAWWLDRSWLAVSHLLFGVAEITAFLAGLLLLKLAPGLRIHLVPRGLRYRRAHDNALKQFLAHNIHVTEQRTGVLIFVSLSERYAEIVADAGIDARVTQAEWSGIVASLVASARTARLVDGLDEAIGEAGTLLAAHFPGGTGNPNELEDHVVEI